MTHSEFFPNTWICVDRTWTAYVAVKHYTFVEGQGGFETGSCTCSDFKISAAISSCFQQVYPIVVSVMNAAGGGIGI